MNRVQRTKTVAACLLAMLSVAGSVSGAAAASVSINSYTSGFYQHTGATPDLGNTNIIEDSTRNTYFAFDLSGVSGNVTGAKLTIFGGNGNYSFNTTTPATVTYSIYDVSTNIGALTNHTGGTAAFADLGSGAVYGSTSLAGAPGFAAMPQLEIDLSGGLNDIILALGGLFALGGSSDLVANQGFLWISSGLNPAAQLTLEVSEVPLPAALPLFAAGLGVVTFVARRKKQKSLAAA